jgi:hypothetical protein
MTSEKAVLRYQRRTSTVIELILKAHLRLNRAYAPMLAAGGREKAHAQLLAACVLFTRSRAGGRYSRGQRRAESAPVPHASVVFCTRADDGDR